MRVELGREPVEPLEQRLELAVGELVPLHQVGKSARERTVRVSGPSRSSSALERPGPRLERLDPPRRAEMGRGDAGELLGRVGEDADPDALGLQPAQRRGRRRARAQVDGRVILGEALEQRPPVRKLLVEPGRIDVRPPGDVREPGVVEGARVAENAVELDRDQHSQCSATATAAGTGITASEPPSPTIRTSAP